MWLVVSEVSLLISSLGWSDVPLTWPILNVMSMMPQLVEKWYGFVFSCLYCGAISPKILFQRFPQQNQVVYYMQIEDQLPSLHRLMEWSQKDYQILNDYAWNFVSLEDAKQAAQSGSRRYEGGRPWEVSISWASKVGFGSTFSMSVKYCRYL